LVQGPPGVYPHQLGGKKRFLGLTPNFDQNISTTEHDINNRKETHQSTDSLTRPTNLVTFGPQTAENGWGFSHPS